jgi:hypothetical protein
VVGDAQDVESAASMEIDELGDREHAVAPARVGVELAEERAEASPHRLQRERVRARAGQKSG